MNGRKEMIIRPAVFVFMLGLILTVPAGAVTRYVPSPYPTIQGAIDASAVTGDEIEVAPGTYNEAIDFGGKAVRIYSSGGPEVTTINATGLNSSVVTCNMGEDANTVLEGLTITGGSGTTIGGYTYGGGMYNNNNSSPTVTDCTFTTNSVTGNGGGMYNNSSSPTVTNCLFNENNASADGGGMYNYPNSNPTVTNCIFSANNANYGGGMYNRQYSKPTVTNCTFSDNTAGTIGGGMCNWENGNPTVSNCMFSSNTASSGGGGMCNNYSAPTVANCKFTSNSATHGGGMYNYPNSNPTVTDSTFSKNTAGTNGGGMHNYFYSDPTVTNCLFTENTANADGGGMYNYDISCPTVSNCIFRTNTANYGGGIYNRQHSNPVVVNCILWGNSTSEIQNFSSSPTVTYSDVQGGYSGVGNIDADPLFVNAAVGDFRLNWYSPCVDIGDNNAPGLAATDLAGNPRIVDGDGDGNPVVDMGAYELQGRVHNITQDRRYETIQSSIDDANPGDQIEAAPGTYYEAIDFCGKAVWLYSTDGPNDTTIDGTGNYHVVQCISGEDANTVLEGFTITGGEANGMGSNNHGGGMYNVGSSPTVTNCTFSSNTAGYGGGMLNNASSPIVTDCNFTDNTATSYGGGMENFNGGSATVTNCTFSENTAVQGGGMINNDSSPTVTDCLFTENTANVDGGGMYNYPNSSPMVSNCIFRANTANYGGGMYNRLNSNPTVTNCTFSNNTAVTNGGAMVNWDNSNPTVANCILWDDSPNEIFDDATSSANVTYSDVQGGVAGSGGNNIDADPRFVSASIGDLRLLSFSRCIDAGNNIALPATITTDLDGNPRFVDDTMVSDSGEGTAPIVDMGAYERQVASEPRKVPAEFATIQEAIDSVSDYEQIAVEPGEYMEAIDFKGKAVRLYSSGGPEVTTINGTGHYHVVQCVSGEGTDTILEGFTITGGNANGLSWPDNCGGGMYNNSSNPTVTNCLFIENTANADGGGMYNYPNSNPTLTECIFRANTANYGGGIYNRKDSNPTLTECDFISNSAPNGGGMYNNSSSPMLSDCNFIGNSATHGGGMSNAITSSPTLLNCIFSGNNSSSGGGGICNNGSTPIVAGCKFTGNSAAHGGGMFNYYYGNTEVFNCTFSGNRALNLGGGMYNEWHSNPKVINCILWCDTPDEISNDGTSNPTVTSSDVKGGWQGTGTGNINADPCFFEPGYWADANDPNIVVGPNDWDAIWIDGNYRLREDSPCIDSGNSIGAPTGILVEADGSIRGLGIAENSGSTEQPTVLVYFDLAGNDRFEDVDGIPNKGSGRLGYIDMGAYEFQCGSVPGDINCDGVVDFKDIAILCNNWLAGTEPEL